MLVLPSKLGRQNTAVSLHSDKLCELYIIRKPTHRRKLEYLRDFEHDRRGRRFRTLVRLIIPHNYLSYALRSDTYL